MKKIFLYFILIFISIGFFISTNTYAFSEEFMLLLETMDIPKENKNGLYINEDIYNSYQLFVYGSPLDNYKGQRWKDVPDGRWTKNGSTWNGYGTRGEYWVLGVNYAGKEVHNHCFPVDIEPPTAPTQWRYAIISDALESWQETDKYIDDVQREYMLTQKLMRNQTTYELTVKDIGFEKVRLENYATWKTKGTVYTERYDKNNKRWAANFMVPPMAGDAKLEGYAIFPLGTEYTMEKETECITIPISYGAEVLNLTDYAKKEHIKEIKSQLWINGEYVEEIADNQVLKINKDTSFLAHKNSSTETHMVLHIQIKSTLFTKFITDGVLTDIKNYTIYIQLNPFVEQEIKTEHDTISDEEFINYPDFPPPKITAIEIKRVVNREKLPLLISKKTEKQFICAGQTIDIKVQAIHIPECVTIEFEGDTSIKTFDKLTKLFEWTEPRERKEKTMVKTLREFEKMYQGKITMKNLYTKKSEEEFECRYIIPYGTKQTLHSWSSLREISQNAFQIKEDKLFSRITEPYQLVFKVSGPTGMSTTRVSLDVFERWDTLYNRDLSKYIKEK